MNNTQERGTTISSVHLAFHPDQLRLSDGSACSLLSHPVLPQSCTSRFPKQHLPCLSTAERPCDPPLPFCPGTQSKLIITTFKAGHTVPHPLAPNPLPLHAHACSTTASPFSRPAMGFSQFCVFTHGTHIYCVPSPCLEQCQELGMSRQMSRAPSLTSWHPPPLSLLLSMPGMLPSSPAQKMLSFNI